MPRDVNGVYTLPAGNPVVTSTVIEPDWANSTFTDIATALTNSLSVDGSVTPAKLADDPEGFQEAIGLFDLWNEYFEKLNFLMSVNTSKIGDIEPFGMDDVPANYFECDGSEKSRATYAALFAAIGTSFGVGDGLTTFNLPDLRGETVRMLDLGRGVDVGRVANSWQDGQVGTHSHVGTATTAGSHSHTATTEASGVHAHSATANSTGAHTHTDSGTSSGHSVNHSHSWSDTSSAAGSHSHTNSISTVATAFTTGTNKTFLTGIGSGSGVTLSTVGNHTHSVSGSTGNQSPGHTHAFSVTTAVNVTHTHTITPANSTSHTHTFNTVDAGSHSHTITINDAGADGMVRNVAVLYCIRYRSEA